MVSHGTELLHFQEIPAAGFGGTLRVEPVASPCRSGKHLSARPVGC
ncbi:hypothetical protein Ga0080574_TMP110 (plasmid) [Salipiger abyssi]|uniref:Uncharacterized protein n=1 Tax=Salipiger abyssi TaxID=1250539 RepID=A0A1P8UM10_9RHOB|nr:hypothetical protein Ga0080574_TMP110 [Salipiger abyssi]